MNTTMQTAKITSGPLPHYTWIPSRGTGIPTEEEKVGVSFLSVLPWDTSSPEWQSIPRLLQGSRSLFCLLTRLTSTEAMPQHQSIRMHEIASVKRTEGSNTAPEVLRVNGELLDLATAPLQQRAHSTLFQAEISICRHRGKEEEKLHVNPRVLLLQEWKLFLFFYSSCRVSQLS